VRRAAIVIAVLAAIGPAPAAHAAAPRVSINASPGRGAAPLHVTFQASGDLATYHWDFGDGTTADGAAVSHVYGPGAFTAKVTATGLDQTTTTVSTRIVSLGLLLRARGVVPFHGHLGFRGKRIATGRTGKSGKFRIGAPISMPGQYVARFEDAVSSPVAVRVRPLVRTSFSGSGLVRRPLVFHARVRPAGSAHLRVRVWRGRRLLIDRTYPGRVRVPLPTGRVGAFRIRLDAIPAAGFAPATRKLRKTVIVPQLGPGSAGPSVHELEAALASQHYALAGVNGYYGFDTFDAVIAFENVHGLPRTGVVDARFWRVLLASGAPRPRFPGDGDHIEINKSRQYLLAIRRGEVVLVTRVSTGATGNTPVGRFHVYSKVPGFNAEQMYYSSFFIGGFAIHGYPSVPIYPASHGCVRIPLWIATHVYALDPVGTTVDIYY
jgi:PKD repeat protein